LIGLASCGGGGGAIDSEISESIVTTNSDGDIVVNGKILIDSSSSDLTISLSNIVFRSDNESCILGYSPNTESVLDVTNGAEIDYEVIIDGFCKDINSLIFEADKTIKYTYTIDDTQKEKIRVEKYTDEVNFKNIAFDKNFNIEINPQIAEVGQVTSFSIRVTDSLGNEISNDNVISVVVRSSNSDKLSLVDEQNITTSEIVYTNLSFKEINVQAKSSGNVKLLVQAVLKSGNNNYKVKKEFDIEIGGGEDFSNKKFKIDLISGKSFIVDSISKFTIEIKDSESDEFIDDSYITNVTVSTSHGLIKFSSDNIGDLNDNYSEDSFEYKSDKSKVIYAKTGKISGLETLKVNVILDINDSYEENISQEFTLAVVSGSPNTISLIYVDSSYENGLYSDRYRVQAIDKYGNPARAGSKIYVGAVSGLIQDDEDKDIYVTGSSTSKGIIKKITNGIEFSVSRSNYFENVSNYDTLVVLADENKLDSSYLGGWIVKDKIDNSRLLLEGDFNITETSELLFLVGNEKRYDPCEQQPKSVDFDSEDNTYELQEDGTTYFILKYPPFMVGKDVYLYANSYDEKRVGVSMRKKLYGTGVSANSVTCADGGKCDKITFSLNDSSYHLTLQELEALSNFSYSGDCDTSKLVTTVNTGCSGVVDLNVYADDNGSCTVYWDNSLPYEH